MADDKLSFMDEGEAVERGPEQPEPEQPEAEPVEPEPQEKQAEGEDQGEPPSPEPEEDRQAIPITALLEERERRQKAEREAEALRRWRDEQERKAREAQQPKPDFYEDPEKAIGHHLQPVQKQVMATKMQMSRFLAEREFGAETVESAVKWFDQNPEMSHRFINEPSPFHAAVEYFKRQQFAQEVQDPEKWRQQERERIKAEIMAEMQSQQPSQPSAPKAPPRSLASAQSTGRDATKPGSGFDRIFE
jgi:hypothetical protein